MRALLGLNVVTSGVNAGGDSPAMMLFGGCLVDMFGAVVLTGSLTCKEAKKLAAKLGPGEALFALPQYYNRRMLEEGDVQVAVENCRYLLTADGIFYVPVCRRPDPYSRKKDAEPCMKPGFIFPGIWQAELEDRLNTLRTQAQAFIAAGIENIPASKAEVPSQLIAA